MNVLYIAGPYDDRQDPIHGVQVGGIRGRNAHE